MKNRVLAISKFLLVLLIFTGLQGRVIMRYAEVYHKNCRSEVITKKGTYIRAGIIHCHLQCYTQQFHMIAIPAIFFLLAIILLGTLVQVYYVPYLDRPVISYAFRRSCLRGPPVLN